MYGKKSCTDFWEKRKNRAREKGKRTGWKKREKEKRENRARKRENRARRKSYEMLKRTRGVENELVG
jgi:hypothetical protein